MLCYIIYYIIQYYILYYLKSSIYIYTYLMVNHDKQWRYVLNKQSYVSIARYFQSIHLDQRWTPLGHIPSILVWANYRPNSPNWKKFGDFGMIYIRHNSGDREQWGYNLPRKLFKTSGDLRSGIVWHRPREYWKTFRLAWLFQRWLVGRWLSPPGHLRRDPVCTWLAWQAKKQHAAKNWSFLFDNSSQTEDSWRFSVSGFSHGQWDFKTKSSKSKTPLWQVPQSMQRTVAWLKRRTDP